MLIDTEAKLSNLKIERIEKLERNAIAKAG